MQQYSIKFHGLGPLFTSFVICYPDIQHSPVCLATLLSDASVCYQFAEIV